MDDRNRGAPIRHKIAVSHVQYLAWKFGLSEAQVEALIEQHGNNRAKLEAAARRLGD